MMILTTITVTLFTVGMMLTSVAEAGRLYLSP